MLKEEFEKRVGMKVANSEWDAINLVYSLSDLNIDKDKFCKLWASINRSRIELFKKRVEADKERCEYKQTLYDIINLLAKYSICGLRGIPILLPDHIEALKFFDIEYEGLDMYKLQFSIQTALNRMKQPLNKDT